MSSSVNVIPPHDNNSTEPAQPDTVQPATVELPRELVQQILDYLSRCPAGDVYPILRALEGR